MLRLCSAVLLLALSACTAVVDSDIGALGPRPIACEPGSERSCACVGGGQGLQRCNEQGKFDPCRCGSSLPAGAAGGGG